MTRSYTKRDPIDRFMSKVEITDDCWNWIGALNEWGYGVFDYGRSKHWRAHRWIYEAVVEPIPERLQIDHLCSNPKCINPDHLEPVTAAENVRRAHVKTECSHGHPWSPENTYIRPNGERAGERQCRTCHRERNLARYRLGKAEGICPYCARTSKDLRRHIKRQHPSHIGGDPASNVNKPISAIDQAAPFGAVYSTQPQEALL